MPAEVVAEAPAGARVVDTASMHLSEIVAEIEAAHAAGHDVARVHSGDPSLYGAISEQIRRLDALGIAWTITPGVPAFAAAAAALGGELTLPDIAQSVIVTRTAVRASAMPERREPGTFAATGATLCIHLSINNLVPIVRELTPILGADMPVAVVYRVSWPDQQIIRGTLATIRAQVKQARITRTALIMVGRVLGEAAFSESRLYAADHSHVLRPRIVRQPGSAPPAPRPRRPRAAEAGQHHHRQPQLARGGELGIGQLATAGLDEQGSDLVPLQQHDLGLDRERRPAGDPDHVVRQIGGPGDAAHDEGERLGRGQLRQGLRPRVANTRRARGRNQPSPSARLSTACQSSPGCSCQFGRCSRKRGTPGRRRPWPHAR